MTSKTVKRVRLLDDSSKKLAPEIKQFHTVCEEARCPNQAECFSHGLATFLVMGDTCTRRCRYCNVQSGRPAPLDPDEKYRLKEIIFRLNLRHIVLTSVDRDDLKDGGATHLRDLAIHLKNELHDIKLEFLLPDFKGKVGSWETILDSPIDVFAHNIETVEDIFSQVRPQGNWQISLDFLHFLAQHRGHDRNYLIKSGLMLGFGEKNSQIQKTLETLHRIGVEVLTIGQYLTPAIGDRYVAHNVIEPAEFAFWSREAKSLGFKYVFSAPFVRSSYLAHQVWEK